MTEDLRFGLKTIPIYGEILFDVIGLGKIITTLGYFFLEIYLTIILYTGIKIVEHRLILIFAFLFTVL